MSIHQSKGREVMYNIHTLYNNTHTHIFMHTLIFFSRVVGSIVSNALLRSTKMSV